MTTIWTKIKKLPWDEPLPRHLENEFREWINELKDIIGQKVEIDNFGKTEKQFDKKATAIILSWMLILYFEV